MRSLGKRAKFLVGPAVPADFREDSADTAGIVAYLLRSVRETHHLYRNRNPQEPP